MFKPSDLTKHEFDQVLTALRTSGRWQVTATMHDLDDKPYRKLGKILDGQVNGTAQGRNLSLTIADPDRKMRDVEGVQSGRFIIRPEYQVIIPSRATAVRIPLISAPMDSCSRADTVVSITGRGKGTLHMKSPVDPFVVPKGIKRTEALMRIAVQAGELRAHMNIPDLPARLKEPFTVGGEQGYWQREQDLADNIGRLLFYNPAGVLTLREPHTHSSFTFRTGDHGFLTKMPEVKVSNDEFHNEIHYRYGNPAKTTLVQDHMVVVKADPSHPLSAQSLAWHGQPRRVILEVFNHQVKRRDTALRLARNILERELLHTVEVTAESYPFPFVEPGDLYRFVSRDYSDVTSVTSWSLPLSPGTPMTLGWSDVRSRGVSR